MQKVENNESVFFFSAETALEKETWIGAIGTFPPHSGKAMIKRSNMNIEE
jgi:hypothetical protein